MKLGRNAVRLDFSSVFTLILRDINILPHLRSHSIIRIIISFLFTFYLTFLILSYRFFDYQHVYLFVT